jgi:hypothetical protein
VGSSRQCADFVGQWREELLASIMTSGLTECHPLDQSRDFGHRATTSGNRITDVLSVRRQRVDGWSEMSADVRESEGGSNTHPVGADRDGFRETLNPSDLLPDGQITDLPVQPPLQKYSDFQKDQITFITLPVLSHRGAARDRHGRGTGCGGRG